ncbi:MAG: glycosyltransferase family 4 protein [Candidatus Sumerlaeaceae bacterium]
MLVRALPFHRQGGLEYHTLDLAGALAKRGHTIVILTSVSAASPPPGLPERICIEYIPNATPGNYSLSFFRNAEHELKRLDREHGFDIIHAQEFAGMFLRRHPGKLVVTIHGTMTTETPLWRFYFRRLSTRQRAEMVWRYKYRLLLQPWFRRMLKRVDRIIVDSEFTRRQLLQINSEVQNKLSIVPLGIDPQRYAFAAPTQAQAHSVPRIGILGRVQKMKGLEVAVRAAKLLRCRGVLFELQIAGSGDYAVGLQQLIGELGLQDVVQYVGALEGGADLASFLSGLDLLVFPDLTQPAFGLVAIEAMHYEVPVVGARSGAIPEVVTDDVGWLYDPWSEAELAATLQVALSDESILKKKSEAARARAQVFTADAMAEQVESVYLSLKSEKG